MQAPSKTKQWSSNSSQTTSLCYSKAKCTLLVCLTLIKCEKTYVNIFISFSFSFFLFFLPFIPCFFLFFSSFLSFFLSFFLYFFLSFFLLPPMRITQKPIDVRKYYTFQMNALLRGIFFLRLERCKSYDCQATAIEHSPKTFVCSVGDFLGFCSIISCVARMVRPHPDN